MSKLEDIILGLQKSQKPVIQRIGKRIEQHHQFMFFSGKNRYHKDYTEYARQAYSETYAPDAMIEDYTAHTDHADHIDYSESTTSHTDHSYSESAHHTDSNAHFHEDHTESYTKHQDNC